MNHEGAFSQSGEDNRYEPTGWENMTSAVSQEDHEKGKGNLDAAVAEPAAPEASMPTEEETKAAFENSTPAENPFAGMTGTETTSDSKFVPSDLPVPPVEPKPRVESDHQIPEPTPEPTPAPMPTEEETIAAFEKTTPEENPFAGMTGPEASAEQ